VEDYIVGGRVLLLIAYLSLLVTAIVILIK